MLAEGLELNASTTPDRQEALDPLHSVAHVLLDVDHHVVSLRLQPLHDPWS